MQRTIKSTRARAPDEAQALNRITGDKSLVTPLAPDETDVQTLLGNLEAASPDQMARVRQSAHWLNPDRCRPEEIAAMQRALLEKQARPIVFEPRRQHQVEPQRLFQQFERLDAEAGRVPRDLLHGFGRRGRAYRRLFEWPPYQVVRRVFAPVDYAIHVCQGVLPSMQRGPQQQQDPLTELQNWLIRSYARVTARTCRQLVARVEVLMAAVLQQVLVRGQRALFVFEWSEAPHFDFAVCFDLCAPWQSDEAADEGIITLYRADVFDDEQAGVTEEKTGGVRALRAALRDGKASYFYHGYVRRDND